MSLQDDAVTGYTQVKEEDAPRLLKIPTSECPDEKKRLPRHKWPRTPTCWPLVVKTSLRKFYLKLGWVEAPNCECLFGHRKHGLLLSATVDDIKVAGKKQNLDLI